MGNLGLGSGSSLSSDCSLWKMGSAEIGSVICFPMNRLTPTYGRVYPLSSMEIGDGSRIRPSE